MSSQKYRLGELLAIRPTGVPFDVLESLETSRVSAAARDLLQRSAELTAAASAAADALGNGEVDDQARKARRRVRRKTLSNAPLPDAIPGVPELPELARYRELHAAVAAARSELAQVLGRELEASRGRLYALAREHLPELATMQLTYHSLDQMLASPSPRSDRSLAMLLQRVCAKNDTVSRFGPSCWGRTDPDEPTLRLAPEPGITQSRVWIERWVVSGLIAAMNQDPEVRAEVAPRANRAIEIVGRQVRWHETGEETEISEADRELIVLCDGRTPAYQLGAAETLARLADAGLVIWKLEGMFVDNDPMATLLADLAAWRDGPVRRRWSEIVQRVADVGEAYARERGVAQRRELVERLQAMLVDLRITQRQRTGRLYEASNPLVEDCTRAGDFALGQRLVDAFLDDATPWLDMFRDMASVAADRVYEGVREVYVKAPRPHGRLSLSRFLAFADSCKVPVRGPALSRFANEAFRDLRAAFARQLSNRADGPEWQLTPEDCRFLASPSVPRPTMQYPTVDLCIAATSNEAIARGDYRWVISELHHGLAQAGQGLSWSCPDRRKFYEELRAVRLQRSPALYDAATSIDVSVHVATEAMTEALDANVISVWRTKPAWKTFSPAMVDVVLEEERRDVRLRDAQTGTDLGSLFPLARFFYGMHPFFPLQLPHHTPRLVRGRTVFQRQAWVVTAEELGGPFDDGSHELVVAVEKLRAARDVPRWVFLRVRDDVLSGSDAMNRGKDVKPICIDLESYVMLEIFARRLEKYRQVELVEMLPAPHELVWREADGRRTFEIRSVIVPA